MSSRNDIGSECNTARRLFWEKCASRQPKVIMVDVESSLLRHYFYEDWDDVAKWADSMLAEWDKRWIVEASDNETDSANEILP